MSDETPQIIGDYEILGLLGAGGMGRVYKVRNVITDRIEAMKVLLPEISGQEEVAARFLREIKVLAALNHPNIATLHTALTIDNQLLMIMEYVEGLALSAVLARGPIPPAEALTYIDQLLDALSFAHHRHVIHRDIKPANMMLTPDGTVKLMDFGIARTEDETSLLTAPGSTLGSINYMSPEQVKGEKTDERSDLYSLGISLYELVTASRPFVGDTSYAMMAAHVNQPPRPPIELQPDMPPGLNQIILTSIAKSPADRFQTADAFRHAVKGVLRELQESKTVVQASYDEKTGSRTPLPQARTGPITRPKPAINTPVPLASRIAAAAQVTAGRTPVPAAPTPVPLAPAPAAAAPTTVYVAPAPVYVAPAPAYVAPVPAAQPASHRGLYVALGAVAVLIVLIAAAVYIPRSRKASAEEGTGPAKQQQAPPPSQPQPTASQPSPQPAETKPAEPVATAPGNAPAVKKDAPKLMAKNAGGQAPDAGAAAAAAAAVKANKEELDKLEHEIDQLTSRSAAVNASVTTLQRQQAASGYGLRGDMVAKQASMNLNLSKAQEAIVHNDAERARRYTEKATADIEALEKFLGR
jgi:cell division protein FtsB